MKNFLIWLTGATLIFFLSLMIFRPLQDGARTGDEPNSPANQTIGSKRNPATGRGKSDRPPGAETAPIQTMRVPPDLIKVLSLSAFDPDTNEFTPELLEVLQLSAAEETGLRTTFNTYFDAHSQAELASAKIVPESEHPKSGHPNQERFTTGQIEPLGEQLEADVAAMEDKLTDLLGRSRGLLATSLISRQLGNAGQGGELVSFIKYKTDQKFAFEVRGLGKHRLRAGHYSGGAVYDAPDLTQLARYKHLAELVDVEQ